MLGSGRLITITNWLADLKTLLPDHTAYAASRSLQDWQQWADGHRTLDDGAAARPAIEVQGRIWRELLTGEKAARDLLKLSRYHAAGRRVAWRVITRFWWVIVGLTLLIAVIIFAGSYLHNIRPRSDCWAASHGWQAPSASRSGELVHCSAPGSKT